MNPGDTEKKMSGLFGSREPEPCTLVIFGASGDLTKRKLVPALFDLFQSGKLPRPFQLIGTSRSAFADEAFRESLRAVIRPTIPSFSEGKWEQFARSIRYVQGAYDDPAHFKDLSDRIDAIDKEVGTKHNRIFYLSTPPEAFDPIVTNLGLAGLDKDEDGFSRIVIEKPFGRDLDSARALNRKVLEVFNEDQIYRIDHYLGKETVQNILILRFANAIFEPIWNRRYIDHIQITSSEAEGVGHRAGYYESSGILRDMFQNHLLQILANIAMEPPVAFEANAIRDEKVKILRSIRPLSTEDACQCTVRGQYGAGVVGGEAVPSYRDEAGVSRGSNTSTFAALKIFIDNWRWQGVPFFLRSGKRLPKRATEVAIQFKHPPLLLFQEQAQPTPNTLLIRIQPNEGISLKFEAKVPGMALDLKPVLMDFDYGTSFKSAISEAYERLLLDCMLGDATLFIRSDEVEAAWSALKPILDSWDHDAPTEPFPNYPSGTWGPKNADGLLEKPWRRWREL